LLDVYAPIRQDAAKRKAQAPGKPRGKKQASVPQQIADEKSDRHARETTAVCAKSAGTNPKYIGLADKLHRR